jgi:hypothetical protein
MNTAATCARESGARFPLAPGLRENKKQKGAFVSESALHIDGDKPNSVVRRLPDAMIIYLDPLA